MLIPFIPFIKCIAHRKKNRNEEMKHRNEAILRNVLINRAQHGEHDLKIVYRSTCGSTEWIKLLDPIRAILCNKNVQTNSSLLLVGHCSYSVTDVHHMGKNERMFRVFVLINDRGTLR